MPKWSSPGTPGDGGGMHAMTQLALWLIHLCEHPEMNTKLQFSLAAVNSPWIEEKIM